MATQPDEDGRDYEVESRPNPDEPDKPTEAEILSAMDGYGGGFVKALAEAYRRGDMNNRFIIRTAFRHYWEQYSTMAIAIRAVKPGNDEEESE